VTRWRLDSGEQSLVLASEGDLPQVLYWGPRLPEGEALEMVAASAARDLTGGMMDRLAPLSLCPEGGGGFLGQPGLRLAEADGTPFVPKFLFRQAEESPGALRLIARDGGLRLIHSLRAEVSGVFTLQTRLEADRPLRLTWLAAPVLPGPEAGAEIWAFHGKWTGEFQRQARPWAQGVFVQEARGGRSGHEAPPYLLLPARGAGEDEGAVWGLHYAWSGGHRLIAEELPDGRRQVQFGHAEGSEIAPGLVFETAPLIAAYSGLGLNGLATLFHADLRKRVLQWPDPARPRPVHYNCWEAVYFKHDMEKLCALADEAAALGAERFVLDDGWFGTRDDDTQSLGDWVVDRRKWPEGLGPFIAHLEKRGLRFGLWVEPEMVSPDSDLARAHPEWVLGPKDQVTGRHQWLLDLSQDAVRDYLFAALAALLSEYRIDYLKWDHNRLAPHLDAAQTRGLYDLLARLRAAFPAVEIESCASGGGRIDAGILAYAQRVWLSDSNDALERLRIQHEAALFLPAAITGSHVGPRQCHTSGRILPMEFRAWVAAQRHMGFEMDLAELTADEKRVLQEVTAWWKANRAWMMAGQIRRLPSDDPAVLAEMQIAADGHRFVAFAAQMTTSAQSLARPLRLSGLDPAARYSIRLRNPEARAAHSRGSAALKTGALTLSGAYLMARGLQLPQAWPGHTLWVVEGERLAEKEAAA
jgi:alpha-galactosidase